MKMKKTSVFVLFNIWNHLYPMFNVLVKMMKWMEVKQIQNILKVS